MIKFTFLIVIIAVVFIGFTSVFLQPDDLKSCPEFPTGVAPCQKADAIVAVSGGDTPSRAAEAIRLYKNGWANYLIFSGAALDKSGPSNAAVMKSMALAAGISDGVIITEETSETTKENAAETESIFTRFNIKNAILVTSGYHQRRAGMEFKHNTVGVEIRNHPVSEDKDWSKWWWLSTRGWYLGISELVKIVVTSVGGNK